uniref:ALMS_motif domain-containing protein n=1 Tax=Hydatigena taeniaeformis TaxID=6205 RepID=A0A0R3X659_HYDTA
LKRTHAPIEQASPPELQSQTPKPRPKGVHSMEVISGSLRSLQSGHDLSISGQSTPFKRSSLNKLQELIEIRRAVVAGSRSELEQLGFGSSSMQSGTLAERTRLPDKLDLSMLRRRCKEHTKHLIQRATYEQKQAELYCKLMGQNLRLTSQET